MGDGNKRDPDDPHALKCCYVPPGGDKKTICPDKKDKVCPDAYNCSLPSPQTGQYGAQCTDPDSPAFKDRWSETLAPLAPLIRLNAPSGEPGMNFMGPIHPRLKRPVGRRLAVALLALGGVTSGARTGPTLSGCSVSAQTMSLSFNASLLGNEGLALRPFDANMSQWYSKQSAHGGKVQRKTDSAGLMVCTKQGTTLDDVSPGPELNATTCACMEWDVLTPPHAGAEDRSLVRYCAVGPGWKPSPATIAHETSKRLALGPHWRHKLGLANEDKDNPFATQWTALAMRAERTNGNQSDVRVEVDLAPLEGQTPLAVRLAWPLFGQMVGKADDACCTSQSWLDGLEPCVPGNCPLYTSVSELPANPFFANIVESKCVCVEPQVC